MPVKTKELIDAIQILADDHNIRVTVKSSLKASAIVAGTTFCFGIVLGPLGIPIGATTGGLYAYCKTKGTFKSAALIIRDEMTDVQRERLCQHVIEAFKEFRPEDLAMLLPLLLTPGHQFQTVALTKIVQFFTEELKMQIID